LGLELDEIALTGDPIEVRARLLGVESDLADVRVWATIGDVDTRLEWDSDSEAFVGVLPSQIPGLRRVAVSAEAVPGGGDHAVEQMIEVVDDRELE
jgi:hypothetical protein